MNKFIDDYNACESPSQQLDFIWQSFCTNLYLLGKFIIQRLQELFDWLSNFNTKENRNSKSDHCEAFTQMLEQIQQEQVEQKKQIQQILQILNYEKVSSQSLRDKLERQFHEPSINDENKDSDSEE